MRTGRSRWLPALALLAAASLGAARSAAAQANATVRGTVSDSTSGHGISGVQITVVGTTVGAVTDTGGRYTLRAPAGTLHLRAQRIGYAPADHQATVEAGGVAEVNFLLHQVAVSLSEVVVVGYGTQSRQQFTGAATNVTGEQITGAPTADLSAGLQGKAPGVQITQNSGDPGNGITVRVRGAASVSASNQPLFVVDGVPISNTSLSQLSPNGQSTSPTSGIDPNDIESITVLKDAASAAIYGSRAGNGVVLITTKRGAQGRPRFFIDAWTGWQNVERKLDLMNAQQYVEYMNEGAVNDGYAPDELPFTPGVDDAVSTDWQDAIFRTAPVGNVHVGVSGGSDRLRYLLDGSYFGQQGIVLGSKYNRTNVRANVDYDATDRFSVASSIGLSHETNYRIAGDNSDNGIVTNAVGQPAIYPVRVGDRFSNPDDDDLVYTNSVAIGAYDRLPTTTDHLIGNVTANYDFDSRFQLTGRAGTDVAHMREDQWQSPLVVGTYAFGANGVAKSGYNNANKYLLESFLTYKDGSEEGSNWNVVGGASVEWNHAELNFIRGEGFPSPSFQYVQSAANIVNYDGIPVDHNLVSYFTRATYNWKDRYMLSGSLRADGSSRFGVDNRWGFFPAISAGWVVSDEPWMGGFGEKLGRLKLRASYGVTGNQDLPNYASLALFTSSPYAGIPGIAPGQFGNPNLKWEQNKEWDAGLDWAPWGGRVSFIADYYHRKTQDLLVSRPIPGTFGRGNTVWDNIGSVVNRGFELGINTVNFEPGSSNGFGWRTDFNISFNHNEVTQLYGGQPIDGDNFRLIDRAAVGYPIGEFYVLHFTGVDPQTGDATYQDVNGDGEITADDRVYAGSPQPKWWGGLANTFSWRGLQLHGFLEFSHGAKLFNLMRIFADDAGYHYDNKFTYAMNRWRQPGDVTDEPRASFDGNSGGLEISDRFIENGSYVRINEITLGWQLPPRLLGWTNMTNAKVYVSGRNLHTFTDYTGYDPDVNSNGAGSQIALGTDYYAYPRARTFSFGISTEW